MPEGCEASTSGVESPLPAHPATQHAPQQPAQDVCA